MAEVTRFVRITYQECRVDERGKGGAFVPMGIEQDIRLVAGHFVIGDPDNATAIVYYVVDGRLENARDRCTVCGYPHDIDTVHGRRG